MKSALRTTLVFGLVAATTTVTALAFYPWPEPPKTSAVVGQPLFEEYTQNQVRSIKVVRYDGDRSDLDVVQLRRRGERWVFPGKSNFVATGSEQISGAISSLMDRTVYEMISDNQEDHNLYGVVDPDEYQNVKNRSSLGTKIELLDMNQKTLANLIVGRGVKNDRQRLKRFVRVPGQPQVYVIDYDVRALASKFYQWNSPNLFGLATQNNPGGNQFRSLTIENYRIDPEKLGQPDERKYLYQVTMIIGPENQLIPSTAQAADENGQLQSVVMDDTQTKTLQEVARMLGVIKYSDVRKKEKSLADTLRKRDEAAEASVFESLAPFGFVKTGMENARFKFDSVAGAVLINMEGGLQIEMSIGTIAGADPDATAKLTHYVMFNAGVDESRFPVPERPEGVPEDGVEMRTYLRAREKVKEDLAAANLAADAMNRIHSGWYYIVSEDVINTIRPDLKLESADKANPPAETGGETSGESDVNPEQQDGN